MEEFDVVVLKNMHVSKREHLCYATAASGYVDVGDVCFVSGRGDFFKVIDIAKSVHKDVLSVLLHRNRVYQVDRKFGGKIEIIPTLNEF